jgi:signal transduction histidine kinase
MKLIPLIVIGIYGIHVLRKLLETKERLANWDKILSNMWIVSLAFIGMSFYPPLKFLVDWYPELLYVIVFTTVYLLRNFRPALFDSSKRVSTDQVYLLRNYRPARLLSISLIPIGVVYLINLFFRIVYPDFFKQNIENFNSAFTFAAFWLIGFGIYAFSQIRKERKLRTKIQEETQVAEARRAELEKLVTERTNQLTLQNEKLERALAELKSTQAQLIQSEKMASLGELTAGIAHEIQNPLNFVNNFSEVSKELMGELKSERAKVIGERDEALENELLGDIEANLEKINHHGKRADAIVKGMLAHSRLSSGEKIPTNVNALADEYLRLSYHGLKAKNNTFNANFKTNFDSDLPKINVVPQDIGRVLLNLINNAFQACASEGVENPTVTVSTKRFQNSIEISVEDNGTGIPDAIKDKIFQPFFTTKPTGQGTGLGLSLSYDIVKAHGGEVKVNSIEGEGCVFIVSLPY